MGRGVQAVGFLGHASPAVDGGSADAEDTGDDGRGFALLDEFDGAATAAFEFSSGSFGSHTVLYASSVTKGIFPRAGLSNCLARPKYGRCGVASNCVLRVRGIGFRVVSGWRGGPPPPERERALGGGSQLDPVCSFSPLW